MAPSEREESIFTGLLPAAPDGINEDSKGDHDLRRIPVVVLTTSSAEEDIIRSCDLHVNCTITKPVDMDRFIEVVQAIDSFWFAIVQLPRGEIDT